MADKKLKDTKAKDEKAKDILITEVAGSSQEKEKASTPLANGDIIDFKGRYIKAIGRRKRSVARVRLFQGGKGIIMVNGKRTQEYFSGEGANLLAQPLKVTGHARDFNFSILVSGGGKQGQVGAVRLGISRTLLIYDPESKEALKANGFLTRDPRQVERKKPGLRKARKAPQWSKR